jgi:hypothetical protein
MVIGSSPVTEEGGIMFNRRVFLKSGAVATVAAGLAAQSTTQAFVPAHIWDKYDFGGGPTIKDRLNQGPFPQYPPEEVLPGSSVVMAITPTKEIVPGFGKGLITYIAGDLLAPKIKGETLEQSIEKLAQIPMGQKLYIRVTWREMQKQRGKLEMPDYWKLTLDMAKKYNKRVAFRVFLSNPDILEPSLPDFVLEKVPMVKLIGEWRGNPNWVRSKKEHAEPRYDHPFFQEAWSEFDGLMAAEYNGHPLIEFMDTYMYGFWGEGHTWPFKNTPFPDTITATKTWMDMLETQIEHWTKTPLVTNTQPDFSRVGNSDLLDGTVRSHNWIRTDTIFIENEQIEALSNRPPWTAAICEVGMSDGTPESLRIDEGVANTDNIIAHVMDVGANYWSLWNWHNINADHIMRYYRQFPEGVDTIARAIGYKVRPSFIWTYAKDGYNGVVVGVANDGIAGVPGVLRLTLQSPEGKTLVSGCLDPGYPLPHKIRQGQLILPKGADWKGLKLKAELEVKGVSYPVLWACKQTLNPDGSLTLRYTRGMEN